MRLATRVRPVCAVFVLERLFQLLVYGPLLHQALLALMCSDSTLPGTSSSSSGDTCTDVTGLITSTLDHMAISRGDNASTPANDVAAVGSAPAGLSLGRSSYDDSNSSMRPQGELTAASDTASTSGRVLKNSKSEGRHGRNGNYCCHRTLVDILQGDQAYPAIMVLRLLVAILQNRHLSGELLLALGMLPRKRQQAAGQGALSGDKSTAADVWLLVQAGLQQLRQQLGVQNPGSNTSHNNSIAHLLTQQYLAGPLQVLVESSIRTALAHMMSATATGATAGESGDSPASNTHKPGGSQGEATTEQILLRVKAGWVGASPNPVCLDQPVGEVFTAALLRLLSMPTLPCSGLWLVGWILYQLLPAEPHDSSTAAPGTSSSSHSKEDVAGLGRLHSQSSSGLGGNDVIRTASCSNVAWEEKLHTAVESARQAFINELGGMWCEAVFPMLTLEWPSAREMLLRPVLRASSEALLSGPHAYPLLQTRSLNGTGQVTDSTGLSQSARSALRSYYCVQRLVASLQLQEVSCSHLLLCTDSTGRPMNACVV